MIRYHYVFDGGGEYTVEVDVERAFRSSPSRQVPDWVALGFEQCSNCPLRPEDHPHCPAAVDLHEVAQKFRSMRSFEEVEVRVETPERTISKRCDVQTGLQSLFGLLMATSGCPVINQLRPLAHLHLPFATFEETLWRVAGSYLLRQYFLARDGQPADFELSGLKELYAQLEVVNRCFCGRLEAASEQDANLNAIVLLSFMSQAVAMDLDVFLDDLRKHLFAPAAPVRERRQLPTPGGD